MSKLQRIRLEREVANANPRPHLLVQWDRSSVDQLLGLPIRCYATDYYEITAYHEAAHAVAMIALRQGFNKVTLEPPEVQINEGYLRVRDYAAYVIIYLAGPAAECFRSGRIDARGAGSDMFNALDICYGEWSWVRGLWLDAVELVRCNWPEISSVATVLLIEREMSAARVREVCKKSKLVNAPSPATVTIGKHRYASSASKVMFKMTEIG